MVQAHHELNKPACGDSSEPGTERPRRKHRSPRLCLIQQADQDVRAPASACHLQGQACHLGVWLQGRPSWSPPPTAGPAGWGMWVGGRRPACRPRPAGTQYPALQALFTRGGEGPLTAE